MPYEVTCNEQLSAAAGTQKVVRIRFSLPPDALTCSYKMYLKWAPHRDLADVIDQFWNQNEHIPEPMIWYVAEALAECGLAMEQGGLDGPDADWDEIVHR